MLQVSHAAIEEIKRLLKGQSKARCLRIGVAKRAGDCRGTSFTLNFIEEPLPDEAILNVEDLKLAMDDETKGLLDDYRLDFSEGLFSGGFRFNKANGGHVCRCGKSVAV